jgi:hypothetical protein
MSDISDFESRPCRQDALHKPHFWGEADTGSRPYRCPGVGRQFFYRDWEKEVRRFHPPGPDQIQARHRGLSVGHQVRHLAGRVRDPRGVAGDTYPGVRE